MVRRHASSQDVETAHAFNRAISFRYDLLTTVRRLELGAVRSMVPTFTYYSCIASWRCPARCYLFNKRELLDAPGEWFHDRDKGTLYLKPRTTTSTCRGTTSSPGR